MTMTTPAPASVAPVPAAQLSRCAAAMTTSFRRAGSTPGRSARTLTTLDIFARHLGIQVQLDFHRHVPVKKPLHPAVVFDRHNSERQRDCVGGLYERQPQTALLSTSIVPPDAPPRALFPLGMSTARTPSAARR